MKAKSLPVLAFVLVLGVFAFIAVIYRNSIPKNSVTAQYLETSTERTPQKETKSWLNDLGKKSEPYAYPATEMKIGIEFKSPRDGTKGSMIVVNELDDYKFFCLNEILKQKNADFAYRQTKNGADVIIYPENETRKNRIMRDLKYYKIQYAVQ